MSDNFIFKVEKCVHEEGTKFYQVILIQDAKRRSVVVTHWGAWHVGAELRPALHGQHKIELHESGGTSAFNQARRKKEKRGYRYWQEVCSHVIPKSEMARAVGMWFDTKDQKVILDYFKDTPDERATWGGLSHDAVWIDEGESFEPPPAPEPEKDPEPTHEEWGTW